MRPGPKPKPKLRLVSGRSPGRRRARGSVKPKPRAPAPPSWLRAEAKAEWRRVAPELDRLGLLALLDRASLAVYCEGWATYVDAQRDVDRRGALVKGHRKQQVKNPSLQIARDQAQLLRALAAEFGLTPSSRARLGAPEVGDEGDEDIFDA